MEQNLQLKYATPRPDKVLTEKRRFIIQLVVFVGILQGFGIFLYVRNMPVTLRGAVIRAGNDPNKQVPLQGVDVVATDGVSQVATRSGAAGGFEITVRRALIRRHALVLSFHHANYEPFDIVDPAANRLYVARMVQIPEKTTPPDSPPMHVANISLRYTVKAPSTVDIGSGAKTFEVTNTANVPCKGDPACSPDGKWRAGTATATLDAGPDNEFRNGRVSCIAGPCPFTSIAHDGFSHGGRTISVTVIDWSDTATFLLQAEAVRSIVSESIRKSYPVIFDHTMSFSLPATAEGTCIEAELDGTAIVFPIWPNLSLSWAQCDAETEGENTRVFRCELKPGYEFK